MRRSLNPSLRGHAESLHVSFKVAQGRRGRAPPPRKARVCTRQVPGFCGASSEERHRRLTGDPDEHLATWLREGASLGINRPVLSAGVFPLVPDEPVSSDYVTGLARNPTGLENYRSADEDTSTATSLLEHMVDQDWADSYSQLDEVTQGVVLNKLALLSKTKSDGSVKHRLGSPTRWSEPSGHARRASSLAPSFRCRSRPQGIGRNKQGRSILGTDVSEAFHQVPLHESERQFIVALAGKYYVFKVLVFGSSSAPTVWGRYAAFLGRSTAAVVGTDPLRLQVYVDDPLYACLAEPPRAARLFSEALLWALVAGYVPVGFA